MPPQPPQPPAPTPQDATFEAKFTAPPVIVITDPIDGRVRRFAVGMQILGVQRVGTDAAGQPVYQISSATSFSRLPESPNGFDSPGGDP
ncbi:MAG: hypothetical protein FJ100_18150 [Deltaproteobacteria bacterium]|nr:hypothetical protein [Deltaproteobacteria bacterium]